MPLTSSAPPATVQELKLIPAAKWKAILEGDAVQARHWMEAAARLGQSEAQAVLGQWCLDGRGGPKNAAHALQWFLKAASQKHPMGINMAGRCYENGWGVDEDLGCATSLYKQAAELGLDAGMYNYANQLASGKGIPQDHRKALGWYSAAAELGYAKAKAKAGRYFEEGLVVEKNLALAFSCYRDGAKGGDFRAQFCYAGMLAARGQRDEALVWLRKVPLTATPAYLAEVGRLLQESPDDEFRKIGSDMLALAATPVPAV